ncbi:putative zinc transporter protein [Abeliophyllum distichum]|uniref:Zinc transporter protein n=1 Tax=Abeliophyllum distichum TaxID=126358 RepID=A0ABD1URL9_9LAMI
MASMQCHKPCEKTNNHVHVQSSSHKTNTEHSFADKVKEVAHSAGKMFGNEHKNQENHGHKHVHAPEHRIGETNKQSAGSGLNGTTTTHHAAAKTEKKKKEGNGNNCMPMILDHMNMHKNKNKTHKKKNKERKHTDGSDSSSSDSDNYARKKKD